jgi:hypothetical protein
MVINPSINSVNRRRDLISLASYAERHDRVDDIVVILLECLDSLLPGHIGLSHDELNVLGLQTRVVNLLAVVLILVLLSLGLRGLALALGVVVTSVSVGTCGLGSSELLSSIDLRLSVQVLNLGLTEDAARCKSSVVSE